MVSPSMAVIAWVAALASVPCAATAVTHGGQHKLSRSRRSFMAKPPKFRGLGDPREAKLKDFKVGKMKCGETHRAHSGSVPDEVCPPECPYYSQDTHDNEHCTFICVVASECAMHNPNRPIADTITTQFGDLRKVCRAPMVQHCLDYMLDGTDRCRTCQQFYTLGEDGQCHSQFMVVVWCIAAVLAIAVVILVVWIVDMACRPITNLEGEHEGLLYRSRSKIRKPKVQGSNDRPLWPLTTWLPTTDVAGPGMVLHFNFQIMVIVWAVVVALGWCALIYFVDSDLAILGTRSFGTPRDNCILVAWGYETQQRLMWTKVLFLCCVYFFSFVGSLLYGVYQLRLFTNIETSYTTMMDFAAKITGIPRTDDPNLEAELKDELGRATNQKIAGVSICWDYEKECDFVAAAIDQVIQEETDKAEAPPPKVEDPAAEIKNPLRKQFFAIEQYLFDEDEPEKQKADKIKEQLLKIKSSDTAFVVFETENDRDNALKALKKNHHGFEFKGNHVRMEKAHCQPNTVNWQNFGESQTRKAFMLGMGLGKILLGLLLWAVCFYLPYAWSIFTWNYDNGSQPGFIYGLSFTLIVTIGNAIMYNICASVADSVRFAFSDDREACYMVLYTIACTFNILLDLVCTYYTACYVMEGLNFRTYHGTKLEDIPTFNERFESYAIQRMLAESSYAYAWPSTYLIPFVLEPVVTIYVPLQLGRLVVRSHKEIRGKAAEDNLAAIVFDMGRYADILLNMVLGIIIFYFPGGYTHSLFFFMAASHIFIYCFDHWRVLRVIPACEYCSMAVDWWSQAMLAPICALILSCLVFKGNCQGYGYCLEGPALPLTCTAAFVVHTVVHLLLLQFFVPRIGRKEDDKTSDKTHKDHHTVVACSWFNANPVHCLRSQYIYEHQPPCIPCVSGKEHLLSANHEIGCHFEDKTPAQAEDFDGLARSLKSGISRTFDSAKDVAHKHSCCG